MQVTNLCSSPSYCRYFSTFLTFRDTTALAARREHLDLSTPPFVPTHNAKQITRIALEPQHGF
jgi:hypothetical protein